MVDIPDGVAPVDSGMTKGKKKASYSPPTQQTVRGRHYCVNRMKERKEGGEWRRTAEPLVLTRRLLRRFVS
jgi:hypothetical protein